MKGLKMTPEQYLECVGQYGMPWSIMLYIGYIWGADKIAILEVLGFVVVFSLVFGFVSAFIDDELKERDD